MIRLLLLLTSSFAFTQSSLIDYSHPYHPTYTQSGIVVSQNYLSSDIGVEILNKGGNAVDAAIAVGFSLTATLPRAGNIGGGGFMQVYIAKDKTILTIDFRSMAPELATREFYQNAIKKDDDITRKGFKAIAVPGTVAGLFKAHELYGSLPMEDLIQPTINLLNEGVPITQDLYLAINKGRYIKNDPESNEIYKKNLSLDGKLKNPDLVKTLKIIQKDGKDSFYKGSIADLIHDQMVKNGGLIRKSDLANYKVNLYSPIATSYRGKKIYAMGAPSGGGIVILTALNVLECFQLSQLTPNSAQTYHLLAEAMKFGHHNRSKYVGDPSFSEIPYDMLLSKDLACDKAKRIKLKEASTPKRTARTGDEVNNSFKESKDTTHYSIVDKDGNAVAVTYTLGYSFGSGVTIPGTGILTNNQMNNFAHSFGIKDSYFRSSSPANKLDPLKRPMSTMSPVMVFNSKGNLELITGSPGGSQIPGVILQVLINSIEFKLDIGAATMVPRIHQDSQSLSMEYEKFLSEDTLKILRSYGHNLKVSDTMGSSQSIEIKDGVKYGYADLRRPDAKVSIQK
jgi:gamma-glutamyltranspeptidase/glutathione hydrolase